MQEIDLNFNWNEFNGKKTLSLLKVCGVLFLVKLLFASRPLTSEELNHASGE